VAIFLASSGSDCFPLSFIRPEAINCIERRNETDFVLTYTRTKRDTSAMYDPQMDQDHAQFYDDLNDDMLSDEAVEESQSDTGHIRRKRSLLLPRIDAGISPVHINFVSNYDDKHHRDYVTPIFSSMVYRTPVSLKRKLKKIHLLNNFCIL